MKNGGNAISMGRITPPLKWHVDGGKHYLAPKIVAMMPGHLHYVEPYAGGLSVLLAKPFEGVSEVANDLSGALTNFWSVLQSDRLFPLFLRAVEATPFSEREYLYAQHRTIGGMPRIVSNDEAVGRAVDFFICCRQSLAGRMKSFAPRSRTRTRGGMNEQVSAWLTAVEGLPAVHERLKRVLILNSKAIDVIRMEDGPHTLFYVDPPYLHETRVSTDDYAHEMTPEQHVDLCTTIRQCRGKVLLSGYPSELYRFQLEECGWHRTDFDLPNNAAGGEAKRRMTECVWSNFKVEAVA